MKEHKTSCLEESKNSKSKLFHGEFLPPTKKAKHWLISVIEELFPPHESGEVEARRGIIQTIEHATSRNNSSVKKTIKSIQKQFGLKIRLLGLSIGDSKSALAHLVRGKQKLPAKEVEHVERLAKQIDKAEIQLNEIHNIIFKRFDVAIPAELNEKNFKRHILFRREEFDLYIQRMRPAQARSEKVKKAPKLQKGRRGLGMQPVIISSKKPSGQKKRRGGHGRPKQNYGKSIPVILCSS